MKQFLHFLESSLRKLTVIDWVFIGFGVIAIAGMLFFLRRSNTWLDIRVKITDPDVLYARAVPSVNYGQAFVEGDVERNELGQVSATITRVDAVQISPTQQAVYLTIHAKGLYSPLKKQYSIKGKPVVFGQSLNFTFTNVRFIGLVTDFPEYRAQKPVQTKKIQVTAQFLNESRNFSEVYGVLSYLSSAVKPGDEIFDSQNHSIVKVLSVDQKPARRTTIDDRGFPRVIEDPLLKDVSYKLELEVKEIDGKYYLYDDIPVQVGGSLPLNFNQVQIFPTVLNFL